MGLSLSQKYFFYVELAKLLEAGFGIRKAAGVMHGTKLPPRQAALLREIEAGLDQNQSISEAFARDPSVTPLERSLIAAGERGGRLADAFQHLADYYQLVREARQETLTSMAYPIMLLNIGIVAGAVIKPLSGGEGGVAILTAVAIHLSILYAVCAVLFIIARAILRTSMTNPAVDAFLNRIPALGAVRRNMAMARFTKVYHICVLAGLSISESARTSAAAAQSGQVLEQGRVLSATAEGGDRLGPVFMASSAFPDAFARSYATAEEAGRLDRDLERWSNLFQENARQGMRLLSALVPKLVMFVVVIFIGIQIVSFYAGQFNDLQHAVEE